MKSRPVLDGVLLDLDAPIRDSVTFSSGVRLYLDTWGSQEEKATVVGKVYSVGELSELGLREGDFVAISYHVISRYTNLADGRTVYHNKLWIDDQWLWPASNDQVHAVWREGKWCAVGEWVLLDEVWPERITSELLHVEQNLNPVMDRGIVLSGIEEWEGHMVSYNPAYRSVYMLPEVVDGVVVGMGKATLIQRRRHVECSITEVKGLMEGIV